MLKLMSSFAILVITQLLFLNAWLSASPRAWLNYLWTALAILLWAQPWSRRDPYKTIRTSSQWFTYLFLGGSTLGWAVIFDSSLPLVILLEVAVLYLLNISGQRALARSRL